jgi:hypothetical protein
MPDAGIVDQHPNPARRVGERPYRLFVGDVAHDPARSDLPRGGLHLGIPISGDHIEPVADQACGDPLPDTPGRPGHHRNAGGTRLSDCPKSGYTSEHIDFDTNGRLTVRHPDLEVDITYTPRFQPMDYSPKTHSGH